MKEVISNNISHIGYDENARVLKVRFKQGGEYHYSDVPPEVYVNLLTAESIGSHFAKNIRKAGYKFVKVEVQAAS